MTKSFICDFIDTEGKHQSRYVDVDETVDIDARDRSIKAQVESRSIRVSRIRRVYRTPARTGKP